MDYAKNIIKKWIKINNAVIVEEIMQDKRIILLKND